MQNSAGADIGGPRSYYEIPSTLPGYVPRAAAPPTQWAIGLSNPLPFVSAGFYNNKVQLIGSANTYGGTPTAASATWEKAGWAAPIRRRVITSCPAQL